LQKNLALWHDLEEEIVKI